MEIKSNNLGVGVPTRLGKTAGATRVGTKLVAHKKTSMLVGLKG